MINCCDEEKPGSWKGFISYTLQGSAFGLGKGMLPRVISGS